MVGNKKYYSRNGEVIDKDKIFYLDIYLEEKIQENDILKSHLNYWKINIYKNFSVSIEIIKKI